MCMWRQLFALAFVSTSACCVELDNGASGGDWARLRVKFAKDPCAVAHVDAEPLSMPSRDLPPFFTAERTTLIVTGGSGFIGSNLVELLLERGYNVRVLDNLETGNVLYLNLKHPRLDFFHGDILDLEQLENVSALRGSTIEAKTQEQLLGNGTESPTQQDNENEYDTPQGAGAGIKRPSIKTTAHDIVGIFHLAAASKVLPSLVDAKMATFNVKNNALGTANLLEVAKRLPNLKKIVYAGSSTYYGNGAVPFREDALFSVSSPYAASKYMGELQMDTFDKVHDVPTVNLRFFMVYGPRNPRKGGYAVVTGIFAEQKKAGKKLTIEGTGEQFRDFVHVEDVGRACILALENEALRGTSINVGSGRAHTVLEAADVVSPGEERVFLPARRNDLKGTLADTCRAKELLKFETQKVFEVEMRKLVEATMRSDDFIDQGMDRVFKKYFARVDADALGGGTSGRTDGSGRDEKPLPYETLSIEEKNVRIRDEIVKKGLLSAVLAEAEPEINPGDEL
eukprot:CAMPEP_0179000354 /NCGR_PEP_ID=MMETSP0795-20121207/10622_1 /TAXON_ID=88552 /ORGANISM="Amoebophrya sp., Strain Ameob2" /LENGTH=510 /DNA_ID=CAMNT_0020693335 /DNA_START=84 /DNA_END=1616 /DNA_ORIENTATION=+